MGVGKKKTIFPYSFKSSAAGAVPSPAVTASGQPASTQGAAALTGAAHDHMAPLDLESMHFQGFSDVQYRASDRKDDHNSFGLGQFT